MDNRKQHNKLHALNSKPSSVQRPLNQERCLIVNLVNLISIQLPWHLENIHQLICQLNVRNGQVNQPCQLTTVWVVYASAIDLQLLYIPLSTLFTDHVVDFQLFDGTSSWILFSTPVSLSFDWAWNCISICLTSAIARQDLPRRTGIPTRQKHSADARPPQGLPPGNLRHGQRLYSQTIDPQTTR